LRDLVEDGMGITQHDEIERRTAIEFAAENAGIHSERISRHLDVDRRRRNAIARQIGNPTSPSLPMVPTSALWPSDVVSTSDATPSTGKYTCSIGRDAS